MPDNDLALKVANHHAIVLKYINATLGQRADFSRAEWGSSAPSGAWVPAPSAPWQRPWGALKRGTWSWQACWLFCFEAEGATAKISDDILDALLMTRTQCAAMSLPDLQN